MCVSQHSHRPAECHGSPSILLGMPPCDLARANRPHLRSRGVWLLMLPLAIITEAVMRAGRQMHSRSNKPTFPPPGCRTCNTITSTGYREELRASGSGKHVGTWQPDAKTSPARCHSRRTTAQDARYGGSFSRSMGAPEILHTLPETEIDAPEGAVRRGRVSRWAGCMSRKQRKKLRTITLHRSSPCRCKL